MIKKLRKLGGSWRAIQLGFAYYCYEGEWQGSKWSLQSYSYSTGSEDSFQSLYLIYRDGVPFRTPTSDPIFSLKNWK